jgi:hypothetical protein
MGSYWSKKDDEHQRLMTIIRALEYRISCVEHSPKAKPKELLPRMQQTLASSIKNHEFKPRKPKSKPKIRGPCGSGLYNELSQAIRHRRVKVCPEENLCVYNWEEQVLNALPL